jgi:hypothetical protein
MLKMYEMNDQENEVGRIGGDMISFNPPAL